MKAHLPTTAQLRYDGLMGGHLVFGHVFLLPNIPVHRPASVFWLLA